MAANFFSAVRVGCRQLATTVKPVIDNATPHVRGFFARAFNPKCPEYEATGATCGAMIVTYNVCRSSYGWAYDDFVPNTVGGTVMIVAGGWVGSMIGPYMIPIAVVARAGYNRGRRDAENRGK